MEKVTVKASKTYDVIIGTGFFDDAGSMIRKTVGGQVAAIISDDTVFELYGKRLINSLENSGYRVVKHVFTKGEVSKNTETYLSIVEFLAAEKLTRSDVVIALGGGVPGDIAGFAAASYMRGVHFVQIPTSLLAMVDSSVGGKTGVNLTAGKNLLGAFYQPDLVLCDVSLLSTLPQEVFADGMAEVIKYGMIRDKTLLEVLGDCSLVALSDIISRCIEIKRDIVAEDEFEQSTRKLLNFGHTVGHAIEKLSNYEISHGAAVAIGMAVETRAAVSMGLCDESCLDELIETLQKHKLPTSLADLPDKTKYNAKNLAEVCLSDKKRDGDSITMVFPEKPGSCILKEIPVGELEDIIALEL
ncbi:MAG: 3-dehydroquinate synthase [Oscillospiraceae bacterium]|nr:3-dehydroquinate synthase [Oscillospiraceae bacterium]